MLFLPSDLARLVQGLRDDQRALFATHLEIGVEAPPRPVVAEAQRAPEPPVVEAPAMAPSPPAPPLVKPPEPEVPVKAPLREAIESHSHRLFEAAADAVAQAGKALTREDDGGGDTIASGDSDATMVGLVAAGGTGTTPTRNRGAKIGGKPGGHGTSVRPDAVVEPDLTRGAHAPSVITDDCPFPSEADLARVDHAVVLLVVTVLPDGHAGAVRVVQDPGHGFGRAAIACAKRQTYVFARDRRGNHLQADTAPFNMRFTR